MITSMSLTAARKTTMLIVKKLLATTLLLTTFLYQLDSQATIQEKAISSSQWQIPLINEDLKTNLEKFKGKVIWLDFWASWCMPCRASFPWLNTMQKRYQAKGLQVIAINVDENTDDAKDFLQQVPAGFKVFFDPEGNAPAAFDIKGMPTSVVIDRSGNIHLFHIGFNENDKAELEKIIRKTLATTTAKGP